MDVTLLGDFKKYYDPKRKTNYWVLGYFGGGSINVQDAWEAAKQYAECTKTDIANVKITEILISRRYKHFKVLFSSESDQMPEKDSTIFDDVWDLLTD